MYTSESSESYFHGTWLLGGGLPAGLTHLNVLLGDLP